MNHYSLNKFFDDTKGVQGWLSFHDAAVIDSILMIQTSDGVEGDILEIGVFEGKSAVLLGRHLRNEEELHVCDIFEDPTDTKNLEEIHTSYPDLSRKKFESNALKYLGFLPTIHQCQSSQLSSRLVRNTFRLIHVDGSHLYDHVKSDLIYAASAVMQNEGIVVVDDFRSQHTIGVTVAVWQMIFEGNLVPLVITPAKMYLGKSETEFNIDRLRPTLESLGIECVIEDVLGFKVLRTVGLQDSDLYSRKRGIAPYLPPILANFIRKSYLWKKLRSR